eukprot:15379854-Alexandrium_andersonii.AAC.1
MLGDVGESWGEGHELGKADPKPKAKAVTKKPSMNDGSSKEGELMKGISKQVKAIAGLAVKVAEASKK